MSEYIRTRTQLRADHLDCLATALADLEPAWAGHVVIAPAGVAMRGYHASPTVHVVVAKQVAGGWGDLGFAKRADGTLELVADDGHRRNGVGSLEWVQRLTQAYAFRVAEKQAAKAGLVATKTVQRDGSWRVVLTKKRAQTAERVW